MSAHKSTIKKYLDMIDNVQKICLDSKVKKFFFFRTGDTYKALEKNLDDYVTTKESTRRELLSKTQRKFSDFEEVLISRALVSLKEYLLGDRELVVAKYYIGE